MWKNGFRQNSSNDELWIKTLAYFPHVNHEIFEESPNVRATVNLLHFNFSINITMIQEVDISRFHLEKKTHKNIWVGIFEFLILSGGLSEIHGGHFYHLEILGKLKIMIFSSFITLKITASTIQQFDFLFLTFCLLRR